MTSNSMKNYQSALSSCSTSVKVIRETEMSFPLTSHEDELRKAYLGVFENSQSEPVGRASHVFESTTNDYKWKEQLISMANVMKESYVNKYIDATRDVDSLISELKKCEIKEERPNNTKSEETFSVSISNKIYFFPWSIPVVTIGRLKDADIYIPYISRLQVLIYPLEMYKRLLVLDIGSYFGFNTLKRSIAQDLLIVSKPFNRASLLLEQDEIAVVNINNFILTLNPKVCIVCFEQERQVLYSCNHFVCCSTCSKQLEKCPVCNEPVQIVKRAHEITSFVPSKVTSIR